MRLLLRLSWIAKIPKPACISGAETSVTLLCNNIRNRKKQCYKKSLGSTCTQTSQKMRLLGLWMTNAE